MASNSVSASGDGGEADRGGAGGGALGLRGVWGSREGVHSEVRVAPRILTQTPSLTALQTPVSVPPARPRDPQLGVHYYVRFSQILKSGIPKGHSLNAKGYGIALMLKATAQP